MSSRFANLRERIFGRSSLRPLKAPAFLIIDGMQRTQDPALQVDALSLTFAAICQSTGLDAHELITRSHRQLADAYVIHNPEIEAIRAYAAGELK